MGGPERSTTGALGTAPLLERSIALAATAHAGAKDKGDEPYILHPLRVMQRVSDDIRRIIAVLHDVVEDTPVGFDQLRDLGFPDEVVRGVAALTKRADEHGEEGYFRFVERAANDDLARPVKLADIEDNLDLTRIKKPDERDDARIRRYRRARKLVHLIGRERGDDEPRAPTIMPLQGNIGESMVEAECPGERPILVCDFRIDGAEQWTLETGGLRRGRILNVDHHAAIAEMERPVTSTALAVQLLRADPDAGKGAWVVVNHTDCDSVLSSAMLMGSFPPDDDLVAASVAADHTGVEHPVADLLQALDESRHGDRTEAQYLESLRGVRRLLAGEELEPSAQAALTLRRKRRERARDLVERGLVIREGPVALLTLDEEIDGAFFPGLLPDSAVIMLASPHPLQTGRWTVKLRIALGAPPGLRLHQLGVSEWDSAFGGRWNAGSNKREGGTSMSPEEYARRVAERLERPAE
jgi:guanosine-3',5'-bis(diphosphate) 3'-pyrophosphohydrolase